MHLRKLEQKDALYMLEWMHDPSVVRDLQTDFGKKSASSCETFIAESQNDDGNLHMAIVDDSDEYMGTVSLKNIENKTAELAITVRSYAMGKGYSKYAMEKIIDIGFDELNLSSLYWCVSPENKRAVRFYDKNNYHRVSPNVLNIRGGYSEGQIHTYHWYLITREDWKQANYN